VGKSAEERFWGGIEVTKYLEVDPAVSQGDDGETGPEAEAAVWDWLIHDTPEISIDERIADAEYLGRDDIVNYLTKLKTRKSVVSEPMLKHPGHGDQKVHGRRFGSTVDSRIANEAIELTRQNGGLSINMVDGSEPPSGFMVARDSSKFGTVVKAEDFFDRQKGPKLLGAHVIRNRTELLSGRAYLGVWHQTEAARKGPDGKNVKGPDGKDIMDPLPRNRQLVHLDVTDNISDKRRAVSLGRRRDQISVWDVANFEEVQTGGKGGNVSE